MDRNRRNSNAARRRAGQASLGCDEAPGIVAAAALSRRAFLCSAAACPALLATLSPGIALAHFLDHAEQAVRAQSWCDDTFWDDGTGWT
jgi:hypothetical protein